MTQLVHSGESMVPQTKVEGYHSTVPNRALWRISTVACRSQWTSK